MRYRIVMGVLALATCLAGVAPAQEQPAAATTPAAGPHREGSWELSVGVGGTYLDQQVQGLIAAGLQSSAGRVAPGAVVRLGYIIGTHWNLSAGTGVGYVSSTTVIEPFGAITWTPNINAGTSPFLTLGGGVTSLRWKSYRATSQYGVHAGVGLRQSLGEKLALRLEAREQYEKFSTDAFPNAAFEGIGTVGFSWFLGGGPPQDSDGDGVPDKADRCPNTPQGAIVDARGCPIDSDNDGVPDGLDKCPNTPSGVQVDALGCPVDSDQDGVPDYLDRCVNTPAGVQVDANGCPVDSDGDGVADYLDRCPNTPANARPVDANGCPVDSDNDGVADYLDRCPNTPANARPVDANGCPVDSDHDGVPDYLDRCPNTAPGTQVDATGCAVVAARPAPQPVRADTAQAAPLPTARGAALVLRNVNFRPNRAEVLPAAKLELDRIAAAMKGMPDAHWEVAGYTNTIGPRLRNIELSQQRADNVTAYLVSRGVPAASLTARGYGSAHPIASNRTPAGRRLNMRVEIKRLQ